MGLLDANYGQQPQQGQGLLSQIFGNGWDDPKSQAMMAISAGLLRRDFAGGLLEANRVFAGAKDAQMRRELAQMQMEQRRLGLEKARREAANEQGLASLQPQFFQPGAPAMGGTAAVNDALPAEFRIGAQPPIPARAPQFDVKGYTAAALQRGYMNPLQAIELQQKMVKDVPINKLDPEKFTPSSVQKFYQTGDYSVLQPRDKLEATEGVIWNPYDPRMAGRSLPNPNKPFSLGPDGRPVPNVEYQKYELSRARAGAPNTSLRIENKMGEGVAAQVGPMLRESWTAANGAAQQVDAAHRIITAVDTGKLFAGPGANARLKVAQVSQVLGIGGRDEAEKIYNTRQAVRGLAEMTLQGRKQMTGQGAITNQESALAEKAMSGDISDLTVPEIRQLAYASARAARFVYDQHQAMVSNLTADPNTAGLAKFYKPLPLPTSPVMRPAGQAAPTTSTPLIDSLVEKYAR